MSIRDQIAAAEDINTELRYVPEWDVTLRFAELDLDARIKFNNAQTAAQGDELATSKVFVAMLIASAMDPETNEPAFDAKDEAMLRSKNGRLVNELVVEILKLNRMLDDAVEEGKDDSSKTSGSGDDSNSLHDLA